MMWSMKHVLTPLAGAIALLAATFATAARAEPVHIAVPTWVGFGPLYVARDMGFFAKHGVEVVLTVSDDAKQHYPLLLASKYDMVAGAVGTSVLYIKHVDDVQYVTVLDDSNGGDGVVARNDVTTLAGLKGKSIGVNISSISEFYLNVLLRQAGLTEGDVFVVDMPPTAAGRAFMRKEVEAAVTWEPFLSEAKRTDFGHLLADSTGVPGLLADALVVRRQFVREHPEQVKAVVAAWNDAVVFVGAHPAEAAEIMARNFGGWLKNLTAIAEAMQTVRYYGAEDSRVVFGTAAQPGPIYATLKEAIDIWTSLGRVKIKVTPEDILNYTFVGS
jgi:NitT/TauT family transport system substrate-binding protein